MQDISAHIMDIVQNSIRANASRVEIVVEESLSGDVFAFTIKDNGCGMDAATLAKVTDPFFTSRTVRKVGLGLPLLKQNAEATGGSVTIQSTEGAGTSVRALFSHSHLDRPPTGDIPETVVLLLAANPDREIVYRHSTEKGEYTLHSTEIIEFLDGVPLNDPEIIRALRQMIEENTKDL